MAQRVGLSLLGAVPLVRTVREAGDAGAPVVAAEPSSPAAAAFVDIADRIIEGLRVGAGVVGHA